MKRGIDLVGASVALVLLAPVLAWVAVALLATQGRPVLFTHPRPGLHARPFRVVKFRTMRPPRRGEVWYSSDAERVTPIGRFLRATSIDELPQLWNVIRGEMSLVGPRPLLMEYVPHYTARERLRHAMRPGITGWAAINGRNTARFEDRLELDVWYVENWSLRLDVQILMTTVAQVLRRTDVDPTQQLEEIAFPERFRTALDDALRTTGALGDPAAEPGRLASSGSGPEPGGPKGP
jgi:lipopolysaccharide/colanic/teichoic acid biosynthesis glycosyltransferase